MPLQYWQRACRPGGPTSQRPAAFCERGSWTRICLARARGWCDGSGEFASLHLTSWSCSPSRWAPWRRQQWPSSSWWRARGDRQLHRRGVSVPAHPAAQPHPL